MGLVLVWLVADELELQAEKRPSLLGKMACS